MQETNPVGGSLQILLLLAFLIPAILFLLAQQNTLKAIRIENRHMPPGQVWLQLIPLFNFIWQFVVVIKIADSIKKEIASRQDDSILGFADMTAVEQADKRPTFMIGMAWCTLIVVGSILNFNHFRTFPIIWLGLLCSFAGMTCWIIYWIQLAGHKSDLKQTASSPA